MDNKEEQVDMTMDVTTGLMSQSSLRLTESPLIRSFLNFDANNYSYLQDLSSVTLASPDFEESIHKNNVSGISNSVIKEAEDFVNDCFLKPSQFDFDQSGMKFFSFSYLI